jgi:uncharacterized Zn finger protein (UPF0148 family)
LNYEIHKFFCPSCGKETIPLSRKKSLKHKNFHRKKLYCPWCQKTLNCIEVLNSEEEKAFKEAFEKGEFENEAAEFVDSGWDSWLREVNLGKKQPRKI